MATSPAAPRCCPSASEKRLLAPSSPWGQRKVSGPLNEGMVRKRRKLNKEMEAEIAASIKKVEFISAMIRDITEEDIQNEYAEAFAQVHLAAKQLGELYKIEGFTEQSEATLALYKDLLKNFEEEYEL